MVFSSASSGRSYIWVPSDVLPSSGARNLCVRPSFHSLRAFFVERVSIHTRSGKTWRSLASWRRTRGTATRRRRGWREISRGAAGRRGATQRNFGQLLCLSLEMALSIADSPFSTFFPVILRLPLFPAIRRTPSFPRVITPSPGRSHRSRRRPGS